MYLGCLRSELCAISSTEQGYELNTVAPGAWMILWCHWSVDLLAIATLAWSDKNNKPASRLLVYSVAREYMAGVEGECIVT